jgi:hypothetical protein
MGVPEQSNEAKVKYPAPDRAHYFNEVDYDSMYACPRKAVTIQQI